MPRRSKPSRRPRKVRYAVVGLGHIAQVAVLPAFAHAANSELAALISDDEVKLKTLARKYQVDVVGSYDAFEDHLREGEVDAVYIALPNSQHREYTERAARAGAHVLCEKPMAVTARDCEAMIRATARAGVRLMIAYRLHFEAANLTAVQVARSGRIGQARLFDSVFTMNVAAGNIRLQRGLGGGTLFDIGIYCINAARYLFADEPYEVAAFSVAGRDRRFREVDEATSAILRFPGDRIASFTCSFGAADVSSYRIVGTRGDLRVEPAYEYAGELKHTLTVDGRSKERAFAPRDQFAPELIHFSSCILGGREPRPGGREGLADVRIIEALYRSARTGRAVPLPPFRKPPRPSLNKEMRRPKVKEPRTVRVEAPSQD